jgi:hypothetical protein
MKHARAALPLKMQKTFFKSLADVSPAESARMAR